MPNPFDKIRPDFEANTQLPEWHQMGEQGQPLNVSPFVDALKKRMSQVPEAGGLGASMGEAAGGAKQGMQSL